VLSDLVDEVDAEPREERPDRDERERADGHIGEKLDGGQAALVGHGTRKRAPR